MTAHCRKGCGLCWPRDPILEVVCPTCRAAVDVKCRRPSGHACEPHAPRDILADQAGHYGPCPWGCCGLENVVMRDGRQLQVFKGDG